MDTNNEILIKESNIFVATSFCLHFKNLCLIIKLKNIILIILASIVVVTCQYV